MLEIRKLKLCHCTQIGFTLPLSELLIGKKDHAVRTVSELSSQLLRSFNSELSIKHVGKPPISSEVNAYTALAKMQWLF